MINISEPQESPVYLMVEEVPLDQLVGPRNEGFLEQEINIPEPPEQEMNIPEPQIENNL